MQPAFSLHCMYTLQVHSSPGWAWQRQVGSLQRQVAFFFICCFYHSLAVISDKYYPIVEIFWYQSVTNLSLFEMDKAKWWKGVAHHKCPMGHFLDKITIQLPFPFNSFLYVAVLVLMHQTLHLDIVKRPGESKNFGGRKLRCPQTGCIISKYDMW